LSIRKSSCWLDFFQC